MVKETFSVEFTCGRLHGTPVMILVGKEGRGYIPFLLSLMGQNSHMNMMFQAGMKLIGLEDKLNQLLNHETVELDKDKVYGSLTCIGEWTLEHFNGQTYRRFTPGLVVDGRPA